MNSRRLNEVSPWYSYGLSQSGMKVRQSIAIYYARFWRQSEVYSYGLSHFDARIWQEDSGIKVKYIAMDCLTFVPGGGGGWVVTWQIATFLQKNSKKKVRQSVAIYFARFWRQSEVQSYGLSHF